jgi:Na+-driven multidrug efflux pump
MLATAKTEHDKKIVIQDSLSFSMYLSVILLFVGLIFYPAIIEAVVKNDTVAQLSRDAVFWLTLAIPARLLQFVGAMILFGSNRGRYLIPVFGIAIVLNGLFNWVLMYQMKMGFSGSYLATFIISYLACILHKEGKEPCKCLI